MSRCGGCSIISFPSEERLTRVWTSYNDLETSAELGCDFCGLCRHYLANWHRKQSLRESSGEVRLYVNGNYWQLECKDLQGGPALVTEKINDVDGVDGAVVVQGVGAKMQRLMQAKRWLRKCLTSHNDCGLVGWLNESTSAIFERLPKRLIDVSVMDEVLLLNCRKCIEEDFITVDELSEYCTLSYRWGPTAHSCTLTEPFDVMKEVSIDDMPQTFQDGIAVARELGIQFIWIDALCIIQPTAADDNDWRDESMRMSAIYENAICTIAATCAQHAYEGFLEQVGTSSFRATSCTFEGAPSAEDKAQSAQLIRVHPRKPDFFQSVSMSLLNERGWVMQERALSKRILHFTEQGLFWECVTAKAHDQWGEYENDDLGACRNLESMMSIARARKTRHFCPVEWFHFAKQYSWAKFTRPADRLVALSSVARAVQPLLGDEYLAGIWKKDLIRGLEWQSSRPMDSPRDPSLPSWSWVSAASSIEFTALGLDALRTKLVEVVDYHMEPLPEMDIYGKLREARLGLRGTLAMCELSTVNEWTDYSKISWDVVQHDGRSEEEEQAAKINRQPSEPSAVATEETAAPEGTPFEAPRRTFTLLPLAMGSDSVVGGVVDVGCIILEPIGQTETNSHGIVVSIQGRYRRLGWVVSNSFLLSNNAGERKRQFLRDYIITKPDYRGMQSFRQSWMNLEPTIVILV